MKKLIVMLALVLAMVGSSFASNRDFSSTVTPKENFQPLTTCRMSGYITGTPSYSTTASIVMGTGNVSDEFSTVIEEGFGHYVSNAFFPVGDSLTVFISATPYSPYIGTKGYKVGSPNCIVGTIALIV